MNAPRTVSTIFVAIIAALSLAACGADPTRIATPSQTATPTPIPYRDIMVSIGQPFTIGPKHRVFVNADGFVIDYVAVVSDSRCARDVQCVTAGRAVIEFAITLDTTQAAVSYLFGIGDRGPEPTARTVGDYLVTLNAVEPQPHSDGRPLDYRATLVVTVVDP